MEHIKSKKNESIYLGRTEQVLDFYAVHMAYSLLDLYVILSNITSLSKISFDLLNSVSCVLFSS